MGKLLANKVYQRFCIIVKKKSILKKIQMMSDTEIQRGTTFSDMGAGRVSRFGVFQDRILKFSESAQLMRRFEWCGQI